jgi:hypothetical protein
MRDLVPDDLTSPNHPSSLWGNIEVVKGVATLSLRAQSKASRHTMPGISSQNAGPFAAWYAAFLPSEDLTEAMMIFAAKSPPVFRGK